MKFVSCILLVILSAAAGWLVGQYSTTERLNNLTDAVESLGDFSELDLAKELVTLKVQEQITLLEKLENEEYSEAKLILVESLQVYYVGLKESIEDGMVSQGELGMLDRLHTLAKGSSLFEKIVH